MIDCLEYRQLNCGHPIVTLFFSACNTVSGYDFVVNTVWPEVVSNIEARASSIFAPGNPNVFHEVHWLQLKVITVSRVFCLVVDYHISLIFGEIVVIE